MQTPNLFDFATSELSQDAFICWLASWAKPEHRELHGPLHKTATAFLNRLLDVGNVSRPAEYWCIVVWRQWNNIDVLLLVNGEIAIIIEDKINSKDHSDQLRRYKMGVEAQFPNHRIAAIYFKTGDQCDYRNAEEAGYGCFRRADFLGILQGREALGVTNEIFKDFQRWLQSIENAVQSFLTVLPEDWKKKQWIGFFMAVQEKLDDGEWAVRVGYDLTFRWHQKDGKYLRLLEGDCRLAFCLEVVEEMHRRAKRDDWHRMLLATSPPAGIALSTPRLGLGRRMKVAVLKDYLQLDARGLLDLTKTVGMLREAEALMDAALGTA